MKDLNTKRGPTQFWFQFNSFYAQVSSCSKNAF